MTHQYPAKSFGFKDLVRGFAVSFGLLGALIIAVAGATPSAMAAGKGEIYTEDGVAINGTDPVAYFTQSKPVQGSADYTYEWKGATWRFASAENRDLFAVNPEKYAPQYGGWCAYGVAKGAKATTEPELWTIVDGKLYLNYSPKVQSTWEEDIPGYIEQANENWVALQ